MIDKEDMDRLSLKEMESLVAELQLRIAKRRYDCTEKKEQVFEAVKSIVCSLMDIDYDPSSRELRQVTARTIIANALVHKGFSETGLGRMMKKDHSTIHHYKDLLKMWKSCPKYYEDELDIWYKTKARI